MINFSAFEMARQSYSTKDMPFLIKFKKMVQNDKPYQGFKILHNIPLTLQAVLKIEPLLLGGADVTVSCVSFLEPQKQALDILKAAKVKLQIPHHFKEIYDFHLDCCAELICIPPPKIGAVELTQTGSESYRKTSLAYPVISIDDSPLKCLETFLGTGDGFVRALIEITNKPINNKKFVIFGYGKVGKGLVYALKKFTKNISVIDACVNSISDISMEVLHKDDRQHILKALKNAYCIVTATGIKNILSEGYNIKKSDCGHALLANMGADDEYGKNFEIEDVLFQKKPLNFFISEPTLMKYLDPIFYAHNMGVNKLLSNPIPSGYHPFSKKCALAILKKWSDFHDEDFTQWEDL